MESIVDKIRSRIDLLNTLYPHEHGRYYVDHEYGGYKLFFATAYSEEKCLSARMKPTECIRMLDVLIQVAEHEADFKKKGGDDQCAAAVPATCIGRLRTRTTSALPAEATAAWRNAQTNCKTSC